MQFQQMAVLFADASSQKNSDKGGNNVIPVILVYSRLPCHTVPQGEHGPRVSATSNPRGRRR